MVTGEYNYRKIKEDTRKSKNQLGSKLWEPQRTTKRKPYPRPVLEFLQLCLEATKEGEREQST